MTARHEAARLDGEVDDDPRASRLGRRLDDERLLAGQRIPEDIAGAHRERVVCDRHASECAGRRDAPAPLVCGVFWPPRVASECVGGRTRRNAVDRGGGGLRQPRRAVPRGVARLRRLVPFDASVWLAVDPATGLPTAPTRGRGPRLRRRRLPARLGARVPSRTSTCTATSPRRGPGGRPAHGDGRSAGPQRALPRAPAAARGSRTSCAASCASTGTVGVRSRIPSAHAGVRRADGAARRALRAARALPCGSTPAPRPRAGRPRRRGPGLLVFAPSGELVTVNDDARAWLDELSRRGSTSRDAVRGRAADRRGGHADARPRDRRGARPRHRPRADPVTRDRPLARLPRVLLRDADGASATRRW